LNDGVCIEDYICGNYSFYTCIPPADFTPPECPDNCTGNGICVNVSFCEWIDAQPGHKWVDKSVDPPRTYICDPAFLNYTISKNQSSLCACVNGRTGLNCGVAGGYLGALAAGLAAGILALIIVLGILGAAICGGGAVAATTAMAAEPEGAVEVNPLYEGAGSEAVNPLFGGN